MAKCILVINYMMIKMLQYNTVPDVDELQHNLASPYRSIVLFMSDDNTEIYQDHNIHKIETNIHA